MIDYEFATASVPGTRHQRAGKNNQDAHVLLVGDDLAVAVVADGCGSGPYSEIGARIGATIMANTLMQWGPPEDAYVAVNIARLHLLGALSTLGLRMAPSPVAARQTIQNHFLFTLVVAIITQTKVFVYALGDGVFGINGFINEWDYEENKPPYLAYDLIDPDAHMAFECRLDWATEGVDSLIIGTDGVSDLLAAEGKVIPGNRSAVVGNVKDLAEDDLLFSNEDALRRYLTLIGRDSVKLAKDGSGLDKQFGLLSDDTTLIVARRRR